ncbi:MAG: DegQ family serine endoprotease [Alcaligenaceae bacterium]|nr:DegQ family serine endoprotease [Alcaligenaceae bacterium]
MFSIKGSQKLKRWLACASASFLVASASFTATADTRSVAPGVNLPDFTQIVEKTESSVVNIRTTASVPVRRSPMGPNGNDPYEMFRWFFGPDFMPPGAAPQQRERQGSQEQERTVPRGVGSGFIISEDGYIITNNHVIAQAHGIYVTLTSGKEYKADVVGTDARTDIAVLKIDAKGLPVLPIGSSNELKKGQWVLAIGSPFGLESTVTAGIVSAINRDTGDYLPFIQTDVAVNPGNSGGPLIDLNGRVVGVNSQIVSQSGGFMGISLAIPIDEAMRVVSQLKEHGKVSRGRIGVQIGVVTDDVAKAIGLDAAKGAMVSQVEPSGPAAKAGVLPGDVILKFDGKDIKQMSDLPRVVGQTKPGTRAALEVWRKGKAETLQVRVGEMSTPDEATGKPAEVEKAGATDALGLQVRNLTDAERSSLNVQGGVQVVDVQEPASSAGLMKGDIILTINTTDISNADQYAKVVAGLNATRASALLVVRGGQSQWVTLTPAKK